MALGKSEIRIKLADGTELSGTVQNVRRALTAMGYDANAYLNKSGLYYSESKREYVSIASMATPYLRNAVNKRYEEWLLSLKGLSNTRFVRAMYDGPENLAALIAELEKRGDE